MIIEFEPSLNAPIAVRTQENDAKIHATVTHPLFLGKEAKNPQITTEIPHHQPPSFTLFKKLYTVPPKPSSMIPKIKVIEPRILRREEWIGSAIGSGQVAQLPP
jgi:hypothetical protein